MNNDVINQAAAGVKVGGTWLQKVFNFEADPADLRVSMKRLLETHVSQLFAGAEEIRLLWYATSVPKNQAVPVC